MSAATKVNGPKPSLGPDRAPVGKREPKPCPLCATPTRHHCRTCGVVRCALCLSDADRCQRCERA